MILCVCVLLKASLTPATSAERLGHGTETVPSTPKPLGHFNPLSGSFGKLSVDSLRGP